MNPIEALAVEKGESIVRRWCKDFLKKNTISGVPPAIRANFKKKDVEARYLIQDGRCNLCHTPTSLKAMEQDHIMPVIKGGETNAKNLELLCESCHDQKGTEHPSDTAKRLNTTLERIYRGWQ